LRSVMSVELTSVAYKQQIEGTTGGVNGHELALSD